MDSAKSIHQKTNYTYRSAFFAESLAYECDFARFDIMINLLIMEEKNRRDLPVVKVAYGWRIEQTNLPPSI